MNVNVLKSLQPFMVAAIFIVVYIIEHIIPERKQIAGNKHDGINILVGLGDLVIIGAGGYFLQWVLIRLHEQHFGLLYSLPLWARLIIGFILADLFMYWWHRANHIVPFLWYFHSFHHRDKQLNTTSSVRFHAGELLLSYVFKVPLFALLGISAATVVVYGLAIVLVVTVHHSNIKITKSADGVIRLFFVSPLMHRIHHSVIKEETNANYSSVFPYWDKLFGSYISEPKEPIEFGI